MTLNSLLFTKNKCRISTPNYIFNRYYGNTAQIFLKSCHSRFFNVYFFHSPSVFFNSTKSFFSSCSNSFSDKKVEFNNLPLSQDYITNLKSLGINDLKLFQYIIFKLLTDNLSVDGDINTNKRFNRLVFYNDLGSGQTIGTLIPLVYLYSINKHKPANNSIKRPSGPLLILCSRKNCKKISNFILGLNPFLKCLLLDEGTTNDFATRKFPLSSSNGLDTNSTDFIDKLLKENVLTRETSYDIIVASHKILHKLSEKSRRRNIPLLSKASCVLFDDFSELISEHSSFDFFLKNLKLLRDSKSLNSTASTSSNDFHIICLTISLVDNFPEYSRKNLPNYTLYDFKFDNRTDALKIEVDFGESSIINLESPELTENKQLEHSICKVSKSGKYERFQVLKNLVYSYLDLPTFFSHQSYPPSIKRPIAKSKCIIFVSNRKQLNNLANLKEFSNLCVYLGKHLNVYERADSISSFNSGTKPIMIATDHSVYRANFEDVSYVFNFNPPKTIESYKSRSRFCRKLGSLCVTLYSKDQYSNLVSVVKNYVKKLSIHIVPSNEYMMNHDLKWLKKFASEIIKNNINLINPYLSRSEDLLERYGDSIIEFCTNVLLRDKLDFLVQPKFEKDEISHNSILSGKSGYTAVTINDDSRQYLNNISDVKNLFSKYLPDSKINSILRKCYKTENGYIFDISNKYLRNFIELSKDNPDIYVQIPTTLPKILPNDNNIHIGKVQLKGLTSSKIKIRNPPKIDVDFIS